jgi:Flp pilus assembly protein TadD
MPTLRLLPALAFTVALLRPCLGTAEQSGGGARAPQNTANTVSVDWLRDVQSKETRRSLKRAESYSAAGEHRKAIEILSQLVVKSNVSEPYVRGILGFEYLQIGRVEEARTELAVSVRFLPNEAVGRSNFALALYVLGEYERAFQEITQALVLEPGNLTSQLILHKIVSRQSP